MKVRDFFILLFRMLIVYMLASNFVTALYFGVQVASMSGDALEGSFLFYLLLSSIIGLLLAYLFIRIAPKLVDLLGLTKNFEEDRINLGAWSSKQYMYVAMILIGVLVIALNLTSAISAIWQRAFVELMPGQDPAALTPVYTVVLGLVIILLAKSLGGWMAKIADERWDEGE